MWSPFFITKTKNKLSTILFLSFLGLLKNHKLINSELL